MKRTKEVTMKLWLNRKPPSTGIDIGRRTLKGVELTKKNDKVYLQKCFIQDLSELNPEFPDKQNIFENLKAVTNVFICQGNRYNIALHNDEADSLEIILPKMPEKELRIAILREIEKTLKVSSAEVEFDYFPLDIDHGKPDNQISLRVVYAMKKIIKQRLIPIIDAGIKVTSLDTEALAVAETLKFNGYTHSGGNFVFIDLGEQQTTTALVVGTQVLFTHTVPFAFGMINQTLKNRLNLNYSESEKLKEDLHLVSEEKIEVTQAQQIADRVYEHILNGFQEPMDYFQKQTGSTGIENIFLTGGGAAYPAIAEIIQQHYQTETMVINPFRRIELFQGDQDSDINYDVIAPFMSVAVGLALRGVS